MAYIPAAITKKLMSHAIISASPRRGSGGTRVTLRSRYEELQRLRERVEDLEDLRELDAAIKRNGNKPGIPWAQAKLELCFDDD